MAYDAIDSPQLFSIPDRPNFDFEARLVERGFRVVCGVDEAGRGPLAGPVVAAAVILDPANIPDGLHDSKKLTHRKRSALFEELVVTSTIGIASISAATTDRINIREASLLAMTRAVVALEMKADYALIDGNALPRHLPCDASALVKGDGRSVSIAAASIIAKVYRDELMTRAEAQYPGYDFAGHKGYPTAKHRSVLEALGPCPLHRRSFAPVAAVVEKSKKP